MTEFKVITQSNHGIRGAFCKNLLQQSSHFNEMLYTPFSPSLLILFTKAFIDMSLIKDYYKASNLLPKPLKRSS